MPKGNLIAATFKLAHVVSPVDPLTVSHSERLTSIRERALQALDNYLFFVKANHNINSSGKTGIASAQAGSVRKAKDKRKPTYSPIASNTHTSKRFT